MTAKIYYYPSREKNTKIWQWFQQAKQIKQNSNIVGARVWAMQNVPDQFREMIIKAASE